MKISKKLHIRRKGPGAGQVRINPSWKEQCEKAVLSFPNGKEILHQVNKLSPERQTAFFKAFDKPGIGPLTAYKMSTESYRGPLSRIEELKRLKRAELAKDILPGGKADGLPDKLFHKREIKAGMKVESEHTNNPVIQKEIAKDHTVETGTIKNGKFTSQYYPGLKKLEHKLEAKQPDKKKILYFEIGPSCRVCGQPTGKDWTMTNKIIICPNPKCKQKYERSIFSQ